MVLDLRWAFRLGAIVACFAAGGIVSAQAPAAEFPAGATANRRQTNRRMEHTGHRIWNSVRPAFCPAIRRCAPRSSEVGRASDTRIVALTSYWNMVSMQSKTQIEAVRGLLAHEEERGGEWTMDDNQAEQELPRDSAGSCLKNQRRADSGACESAEGSGNHGRADRAARRAGAGPSAANGLLLDDLRDLLKAAQARQSRD